MKHVFIIVLLLFTATVHTACGQGRHPHNAPITLDNQHDLIIRAEIIRGGDQNCILLRNCSNIRITRCRLTDSKKEGILLENCRNIVIDDNYIANVQTGVNAKRSVTIKVNHNRFLNMNGPFPAGCAVQFNNINGPANQINYNRVVNIPGEAEHPQDQLSVYQSNGLPGDSIQVIGNWIKGGQITKDSGGAAGIVLGDVGGSYQVARDNIVINGGFIGMQVQGGSHIKMDHNTIYSSRTEYTCDGLSYGNYSGKPSTDVEISYNKIRFYNKDNHEVDVWLDLKTVQKPKGWETNELGADIDEKVLPEKLFERH